MFLLLLFSVTSAIDLLAEVELREEVPQVKHKDDQPQQIDNVGLSNMENPNRTFEEPSKTHKIKKRADIKPASANRQTDGKTNDDVVNRRQDMFADGQVLYQPSLLKEPYINLKNVDKQINTLKDLIGKNPNIQLEGLQNFLQSNPQGLTSALSNPQPFQAQKANNEIPTEYSSKLQVNIEELTNTSAPVSQKKLLSLQQQLDEAAKKQAEEALERAQQQAQAHVEAQHKAIAEAQRAIFEKFQNSIYQIPQSLPLVQEQVTTNTLSNPSPQPIPRPDNPIPAPQHNHHIITQNVHPLRHNEIPRQHSNHQIIPQKLPGLYNPVSVTTPASLIVTQTVIPQFDQNVQAEKLQWQTIEIPAAPSTLAPPIQLKQSNIVTIEPPKAARQNPLKAALSAQNSIIYAPNHIHESVAQQQAKKAIINQVRFNNKQILNGHKLPNALSVYSSKLSKQALRNKKPAHAREPQATTYQEVVFKPEFQEEIPAAHTKATSGIGDEDEEVSRIICTFLNL